MDKLERIKLIHENISLAKNNMQISECVEKSIKNQLVFWEDEELTIPDKYYNGTVSMYISQERSIEAASKYKGKRVCVLNFASFVTPGGGVLRGTTAQEESVCRVTSLYPAISDQSVSCFYDNHKKKITDGLVGRDNTDDCIYTPNVLCFREDSFECTMLPEEEWYEISVITCAAPDQRYCGGEREYHPSDAKQLFDFEKRIKRILTIAAMYKTEVLILGAFGCGVFGNSPFIVAKAFEKQLTQFKHHFETVEFAVYCRNKSDENYRAFLSIDSVEEISKSEEDNIQNTSVKLPEKYQMISVNKVEQTLLYLEKYCYHTDRDRNQRWDFLCKRSEESFSGGCGGICGYKEYKRNLMYIKPYTSHLRYGKVASALCFIRMQAVDENTSINDVLNTIYEYSDAWYSHKTIADGEYMWRVHSGFNAILERLKKAYCESGGNQEIAAVLDVFSALQWNESRIQAIQSYLDNDDL